MKVTYKDHMGTDLSVVNAARVSFSKESDYEYVCVNGHDLCFGGATKSPDCPYCEVELEEPDKKLIKYLAKNNHWSPFAHTSITLHLKVPIFVARQLVKHQVGLTWNEVSRRYVDDPPEFYFPDAWRKRADNVKQGSSEEILEEINIMPPDCVPYWMPVGKATRDHCHQLGLKFYQMLLENEIAPEQARMILPQNTYTEAYWTGSVAAFARVCKQRLDKNAQKETQEVAQQISDIIEPLFPVSWAALREFS